MDNYYQFNLSIAKALTGSEAPLKMKHARSIILHTHRSKEIKSFWGIIQRQPLMENRFTAWKFCHLFHKILREGHDNVIKQSLTQSTLIHEVGKLWGHLQDGMGKCIEAYTKLIGYKLEFHKKNQWCPGSLAIRFSDLERVAANDFNFYFQLCVEVFDYLDFILDLENYIFIAVNTFRMSSMTPQGQCYLAPLITLIQESNPLYDISARLMFKLHDNLPQDVLVGHRNRFQEIFIKLKEFYENVRPLQYFSDIIQLPKLPDKVPNFASETDLGNYQAPVMSVQEEDHDNINENVAEVPQASSSSSELIALENLLQEKEVFISHLQSEMHEKQSQIQQLSHATNQLAQLKHDNEMYQTNLLVYKENFQQMANLKSEMETKLNDMKPIEANLLKAEEQLKQNETKLQQAEEKCKQSEEKFEKFKKMYAKLREEHINLLKFQNDDSKQLVSEKNALRSEIVFHQEKLHESEEAFAEKEKLLQQLKLEQEEMQKSLNDKYNFRVEELTASLEEKETIIKDFESKLSELSAAVEKSKEEHENIVLDYKQRLDETLVEKAKSNELYESEMKKLKLDLQGNVQKNSTYEQTIDEYNEKMTQKEAIISELNVKIEELSSEKETAAKEYEQQSKKLAEEISANKQLLESKENFINQLELSANEAENSFKIYKEEQTNLVLNLTNKIEEANVEKTKLEQKFANEIQQLKDEFSKTTDEHNAKLVQNETTVSALNIKIEELSSEKETAGKEFEEQSKKLSEEILANKQLLESRENIINQLESSVNEAENSFKIYKEEQTNLVLDLTGKIQEATLQKTKLEQNFGNEREQLKRELSENVTKKLEYQKELEQTKIQLMQRNQQVEMLESNSANQSEQMTKLNQNLQIQSVEITNLKQLETELKSNCSLILDILCENIESNYKLEEVESNKMASAIESDVSRLQANLQSLSDAYKLKTEADDNNKQQRLITHCVSISMYLHTLLDRLNYIYNTSNEMEKAKDLRCHFEDVRQLFQTLFDKIKNEHSNTEPVNTSEINRKLEEIKRIATLMCGSLAESFNAGDMLQQELREMDTIINDASQRIMEILENSKSKYDGLQLEVNERILDSCTNLMQCIIVLIKKSRSLQEEIVKEGRGTFTTKEFYKRNSQWTEGLISASKSVAKAANFLVDAANKAIENDSKEHFEIVVAAQEIAASTAQLVISSKVKASNGSQRLSEVTKASRDVSEATGSVVAAVKDGSRVLDLKLEIDMTKLSTSQKKTMEMELQIKVLQLEQALENERLKLMSFRKAFYKNSEEDT